MKIHAIAALTFVLAVSACAPKGVSFSWAEGQEGFANPSWRADKAIAEAVIKTDADLASVTVQMSALKSGSSVIPAEGVKAELIGEVLGEKLDTARFGQCGERNTTDWEAISVADLIGVAESVDVAAGAEQKVWLSVKVPAGTPAGTYTGKLAVKASGKKLATLPVSLTVLDETLPPVSEWGYHLDLWQNPYSVARYHGVELWSEEHFAYLEPVMKMLAEAGQKVITTTILDRPWNGQTEDPFGSMVVKTKKVDGTWAYDYSIFDKWVEFMMGVGIDQQINCYSLIPWSLAFDYIDEATGEQKIIHAAPGSKDYENYWGSFLYDFSKHLRAKGWFEKTMIAMDERPKEAMAAALALIKRIDPEIKVALAGNYHEEIADDLDDLCITFREDYPEGVVEARRAAGKVTTVYTCCAEKYPNTFMASDPDEGAWIAWNVLSRDVDGYLRWAYNSWTADPNKDARFRTWAAGDCYMVYPDAHSSVRFEKFAEGIRDYEKAKILKARWEAEGNAEKLQALRTALDAFTMEKLGEEGPEPALTAARTVIYSE